MTSVQAFALLAAALLTTASAAVLPPSQRNSQEQRAARAWTLHQEDNSTRSDSSRLEDLRTQEELQNPSMPIAVPYVLCLLPTCGVSNLGNRLQGGDEVAGSSTRNPAGPGRK